MTIRALPAAMMAALLSTTTAYAQTAPTPDAGKTDTGKTEAGQAIVVTATRQSTPIGQVTSAITVLDKAAIDRNQDPGVSEQLLRTPGISLSRNGGYGTATSLRIRGAEADQTVVVIDGVKMNDPAGTDGSYNFANLLVGDISRIEVLRGPQSTLWGSQAIGGVVNIVTAMPTRDLEGSFDVEGGSRATLNARAAVGGRTGPVAWRLGGTEFTTRGISALTRAFGGGEKDGYRNQTVTGRATVDLATNLSADVRGYFSHGRVENDGFAGDSPEYSHNQEWLIYTGLNASLFDDRFKNRVSYAHTTTDRDNQDPRRQRTTTFDSSGTNDRFEYQGSVAIADGWNAQFGVDRERSKFDSVAPPAALATPVPNPIRGSATLTGFYGQLIANPIEGLTLTGGVRRDRHNVYGGKTVFSAGGVWTLKTGTTLRASYGEGFKAPSLYQLYSEYGNTALQPTLSHGWEIGAGQSLADGRIVVAANYFERKTRGLVIFASCSFGSVDPLCVTPGTSAFRFGYYLNVNRAEAHGIEATATIRPIERLTLDGNYSWTVSEDRSPGTANFGRWLPRRPRHTANGSATYQWPFGLSTGVAVRWAGRSFDNAANTTSLHGYTLVDLRAELPVGHGLTLFGRVENLGDKEYMTAYRFGTLGRSFYGGVRGRF